MRRTIVGVLGCVLCLTACARCEGTAALPDSGLPYDGGRDERPPGIAPRRPSTCEYAPLLPECEDPPPPPSCDVGVPCRPTRGCRLSNTCVGEVFREIGGADDPLVSCPASAGSIAVTYFAGGYCSDVQAVDMGGCEPGSECGGCGKCLDAGLVSASGSRITFCAKSCVPSLDSNACRNTYECVFGDEVCLPGCESDLECQVRRADSNANGFIDPYDMVSNPDGDRLTCGTTVAAWCDEITSRCRHAGTPDVEAGAPCAVDFDCEADGACLADDGQPGSWPDGYCIKRGCDIVGNECAGDGKCQERGFGAPVCAKACEVAATTSPDDPFSDPRDCRPGYACLWDGSAGAASSNGGCVPGNYNDVRRPNIGAACVDAQTCYSPFGSGECRDLGGGNRCTVFDCGAPGMPPDVCGEGAVCAMLSGSSTTFCIAICGSADDCPVGDGCWDTAEAGIITGGMKVCFPGCRDAPDCPSSERCEGATPTSLGECVPI